MAAVGKDFELVILVQRHVTFQYDRCFPNLRFYIIPHSSFGALEDDYPLSPYFVRSGPSHPAIKDISFVPRKRANRLKDTTRCRFLLFAGIGNLLESLSTCS